MTPERFQALLDAYGADLRRWPDAERADGRAMAMQLTAQLPETLRASWAEATALDAWLADQPVAEPDGALVERILADARRAPKPAEAKPRRPSPWWWPGARVAGLGLAGALAGAFAGAFVVSAALRTGTPPASWDGIERATAFSELPREWSEE